LPETKFQRLLDHENYFYNYLTELTLWNRVLEKLTVTQIVKNFLAFNGTRRFITLSVRAHQLPLP
jgi:hypothetical protein